MCMSLRDEDLCWGGGYAAARHKHSCGLVVVQSVDVRGGGTRISLAPWQSVYYPDSMSKGSNLSFLCKSTDKYLVLGVLYFSFIAF